MSMQFRELAGKAATNGEISASDILALRREDWADGKISPQEAEELFMINDCIGNTDASWCDFFVEALSEYVVNSVAPKGYVDEPQAKWLIARLDNDGGLNSMTELELLARVVEKAVNVPSSLKVYALVQIERAVLTGKGPTRNGGLLDPNCISSAEVQMLRRILFAQGGEGPASVSQQEAELLFRLKDTTIDADNAPEWKTLFVQGVANYLEAFSSYTPLSYERAAELEKFMDQPSPKIGGFLSRMANLDFGAGLKALIGKQADRDHDAEVAAARAITGTEKAWLDTQIQANHRIDALDQALLDFLKEGAA